MTELERQRKQELWIAWIRVFAVVWALLEVGFVSHDYPEGYRTYAWVVTGVLVAGAAVIAWLAQRGLAERGQARLAFAALVFDAAIVYLYFAIYQFEEGIPTRGLVYLAVIEAGVRYGIRGGVALPLVTLPALTAVEWSRAERFAQGDVEPRNITVPLGIQLIMGLIVGGLVKQVWHETRVADERAAEAEELRDQIGRRADQLELVNRAGRALSSSLELDEAFRLFCREISSGVAFDRLALVLAERGRAEIIANVGAAEDTLYPAGTFEQIEGSVLEDLLTGGQPIAIADMLDDPRYPEDRELAKAGLRSRAVAPLGIGGRVLGMISISRSQPDAFTREDLELLTLLGRQLATAIENIRAFDAERTAAEELRRLSALRADFVSLVSHELRGPMASVVGAAATLRQRWRELNPDQRQSFLALIEEETTRLASLVDDVLDTSRLDAGTFSYSFSDVNVEDLVREVTALVDLGQEEVSVRADVQTPLPSVRGDRERIRQVLVNLLTNAVKYTVAGDEVEVRAASDDGYVAISVRDNGPGISSEEQRLIFEKFGRAATGGPKPGAGLGLFIARSITEAHGGSIEVASQKGAGATFTVRLPATAPSLKR
ncbi:MAG: GAF domain-containing protein [Actinobacteria bacterium]|nr:GAF domain-containing protein [Actinomycetota bacterium]